MNYQQIYHRLVKNARNYPPIGYFETHHIKPRCIGGDDSAENLVRMTAREHFIAHLLLAKIHGGKLIHAAWGMSNSGKYTSRKYEWLRRAHGEAVSKRQKGRKLSAETKCKIVTTRKKNGGYVVTELMKDILRKTHIGNTYAKGKKHSAESIEARRKALKGRRRPEISKKQRGSRNHFFGKSHSESSKLKMRLAQLGKKHPYKPRKPLSEELKARKSRAYIEKGIVPPKMFGNQFNKGKIWVSKPAFGIDALIRSDQLDDYLKNGFERGRSKVKRQAMAS